MGVTPYAGEEPSGAIIGGFEPTANGEDYDGEKESEAHSAQRCAAGPQNAEIPDACGRR